MLYCNGFLFVQARENLKCLYWAVTPSRRCPLRGTGNLNFSTWTSAKWELHINAKYIEVNGKICNIQTSAYYMQKLKAKYAIYRLLHILHIKLHISAYFHCIFLHIRLTWIQSIYLHILCIFLAYYWHVFSILHIIFRAYFLYIRPIYLYICYNCFLSHITAYNMHIIAAYLCIFLTCFVHIFCIFD